VSVGFFPGEESPYHKGELWGEFKVPSNYPFRPPRFQPEGRWVSPYVQCGGMCCCVCGLLGPEWSPAHTLFAVASSLLLILFVDLPDCQCGNMPILANLKARRDFTIRWIRDWNVFTFVGLSHRFALLFFFFSLFLSSSLPLFLSSSLPLFSLFLSSFLCSPLIYFRNFFPQQNNGLPQPIISFPKVIVIP